MGEMLGAHGFNHDAGFAGPVPSPGGSIAYREGMGGDQASLRDAKAGGLFLSVG